MKRTGLPKHVRDAVDRASNEQLGAMLAVGQQTPGVIELTLPYPVSANLYWRTRVIAPRKGGAFVSTYVSEEAKQFKTAVALEARANSVRPLVGEVEVELHLYRPQKTGDLDNRIKVLLDALTGIAYADDDAVVKIIAERHDDKHRPRAVVRIVQRTADLFGGAL